MGSYQPAQPAYANWGERAVGYLIDAVLVGLPGALGSACASLARDPDGGYGPTSIFFSTVFGLVGFGLWLYNRVIRSGRTGQSWGRSVMRTRIVGARTGQPIGPWLAFLRELCHIVDSIICYIGWLFPIWDAKRQTLADKIVSTVVVRG